MGQAANRVIRPRTQHCAGAKVGYARTGHSFNFGFQKKVKHPLFAHGHLAYTRGFCPHNGDLLKHEGAKCIINHTESNLFSADFIDWLIFVYINRFYLWIHLECQAVAGNCNGQCYCGVAGWRPEVIPAALIRARCFVRAAIRWDNIASPAPWSSVPQR